MAQNFETTLTVSDGIRAMFWSRDGVTELLRAIEATRLIITAQDRIGFWTIHVTADDNIVVLRKQIEVWQNGKWIAGGHVQIDMICTVRTDINFDSPEARIIIHENQVMTCMEAIARNLTEATGVASARRMIARRAREPGLCHFLPWGLVDDPLTLIQ
jgi:hypothetical protein